MQFATVKLNGDGYGTTDETIAPDAIAIDKLLHSTGARPQKKTDILLECFLFAIEQGLKECQKFIPKL